MTGVGNRIAAGERGGRIRIGEPQAQRKEARPLEHTKANPRPHASMFFADSTTGGKRTVGLEQTAGSPDAGAV
jgi:hypothetical protein